MMNRRTFLKGGTLLGTGLALGLTGRFASAGPANERINVALIGARNMGGRTHLPSLVGSTDCELVAICDVDSDVLASALEDAAVAYADKNGTTGHVGIAGYRDFREVLARDDIDAVVIATPDHWHVPMAMASIRAGKDVYVEKPLSLTIQEGRELVDLEATHRSIVQVGTQQRSDIRFLIASELVQTGALGEITHVDVAIRTRAGNPDRWEAQPVPPELDYDMWLGPVQWTDYHPLRVHYDFRFVPEFSGGDVTNWGAHYLDIAQWALGMDNSGPVSVEGTGRRNSVGALHTCYYDINVDFEYASGIPMTFRTGDGGVRFTGSEGSLFVNRGRLEATPSSLLQNRSRDLEAELRQSGGHMGNWFACIRSRNGSDLRAPLESAHRSATVCHLANIAMDLERPLYWEPSLEIFWDDAHANAMINRPVRPGWNFG